MSWRDDAKGIDWDRITRDPNFDSETTGVAMMAHRQWNGRFFTQAEFECRHCGRCEHDQDFIRQLDFVRELLGEPMLLNSGYRCPVHNQNVGGAVSSFHLKGRAADVRTPTRSYRDKLLWCAGRAGLRGIGSYPDFVHLDNRQNATFWAR